MSEKDQSETGGQKYKLGKNLLGKGSYGEVYSARIVETNEKVAIKKMKPERQKDRVVEREIKLLEDLKHPNIIKLIDSYKEEGIWHLVFEHMKCDLEELIVDKTIPISQPDIKSYLQMILKGLAYCHKKNVLHRDLKPNNLLISHDGTLKIADFGFARKISQQDVEMTPQRFFRWYRAPELLLRAKKYDSKADVWAVGCIFAELMGRYPLFPDTDFTEDGITRKRLSDSDIDIRQLDSIFKVLGTPIQWPEMESLPLYKKFQTFLNFDPYLGPFWVGDLKSISEDASDDALDLLSKMLTCNPKDRISTEEALGHRYFLPANLTTDPAELPTPTSKRKSRVYEHKSQEGLPVSSSLESKPIINSGERTPAKKKLDFKANEPD